MNMINSFLGRMHLASHIELLNDEKKRLIKEGVEYFNKLSKIKRNALPFLPNGFCNFGDDFVVSGLQESDTIYLAVWNLGEAGEKQIEFDSAIKNASVGYPLNNKLSYFINESSLNIKFTENYQARFFEIQLKLDHH